MSSIVVHFPPQTLIPKWEATFLLEMRDFVEVLWLALCLSKYKLFYVSLQPSKRWLKKKG